MMWRNIFEKKIFEPNEHPCDHTFSEKCGRKGAHLVQKNFLDIFFIFFDMIEPTGTYLVFTLIFCDPKPTQILKKKIFKKLGSKLDLVSSQWAQNLTTYRTI